MQSLLRLLPSPRALFIFEAAARRGSFTRAAAELGMSQAAVSYAIKQLEASLGVRLFLRRHRLVTLTEAGERFYHDVAIGLSYIRRSAESLGRLRGHDNVTLSISTAFASHWMLPRLVAFRAALPEIDLRLQTTDKDVDLVAEGIPLGVRQGRGDWSAYDSALLAEEVISAVASPAYLRAAGRPASAAELLRHKLIHLEEPFREASGWSDWFAARGLAYRDDGEGLRLNDHALVVQAAMEGQGIALGWRHLTDRLLEAGLLEQAAEGTLETGAGFFVVWPKGARLSADAEKVRDWLLAQAAKAGDPPLVGKSRPDEERRAVQVS
ncbi:MAG: LysR substrate-binding domain-containing protein [Kiloniellales bacterium]|nr:LysR substrate-binding domain-containing protein [Kiloniellales bacterium]